ncbi:MAG: DUF305 domain-containing protein [Gemmatimonadaceae bacterium]
MLLETAVERRRLHMLVLATLTSMAACSNAGDGKEAAVADGGQPIAYGDSASADAVFLRTLSNHQAGLMFLAHVAHQHHDSVSVRAEALALDEHHHQQTDSALATLRSVTGEEFLPTVTDHYQSLVDTLQRLPPREFDVRFWAEVEGHHRVGIAIVDSSLANLRDPRVTSLAQLIRAQHEDELRELRTLRRP